MNLYIGIVQEIDRHIFWTYICFLNMLRHMRTTLNIDDDLFNRVKKTAARTGRTITALLEDALTKEVAGDAVGRDSFSLRWTPVEGVAAPGVDLSDRDALYEKMEHRY